MIILCDFDKTITLKDSTDEMVKYYDENKLHDIMRRFRGKEINIKSYLTEALDLIGKITAEEFNEKMGIDIEIDPYFKEFSESGYEFRIVSAGSIENIEAVFKKKGIKIPAEKIYSNRLVFDEDGIKVEFTHDANCGYCGVCKKEILKKYKEKYKKVVFVGDGTSDLCAARHADVVFARKGEKMAKVFAEEGRDYIAYESFKEVLNNLEAMV